MKDTHIKSLLFPTQFKRSFFFIFSDALAIQFSLCLSFLLRFEFAISDWYLEVILYAAPLFLIVKLLSFTGFRLYRITWKYVGIRDLGNIFGAIILSVTVLAALMLVVIPILFQFHPLKKLDSFPKSVFIMDGIISFVFVSAIRISKRMYLEVVPRRGNESSGKRTLIIGAGHTGELIVRDIMRQEKSEFHPVGMLDDDRNKLGTYMHGVEVLGSLEELKTIIRKQRVEAVIIAIPSLNYKLLRAIYDSAREAEVRSVKVIRRMYDVNRPDIGLKKLEDIRIEDLIGRKAVEVDYKGIESFLAGKTVLVTGAGGSIGSEIVSQLCAFSPKEIILFDTDETDLHNMELKLGRQYPGSGGNLHYVVGDIRDERRIGEVLGSFRPDIVFHAAAYKHVPMMEYNPYEAVKVNVLGTYNVVRAARASGAGKFIMISTDKAVKPTSVMGATKRIAECICKAFNSDDVTEFISIRFGNVLGSRGSVLPLFLDQLKEGGPITVTHPDIQRYFMTIPEAVSLVLQASTIGKGGEILILDMGEQVKIVKLAEELIKLHGLEPYRDIDITFIGLRPGEKLYEELFTGEEDTLKTKHSMVFVANNADDFSVSDIEAVVTEFETVIMKAHFGDGEDVRGILRKHVRHFLTSG
jgi:FlaA1/EpsC-like NDP-sugar epimerase